MKRRVNISTYMDSQVDTKRPDFSSSALLSSPCLYIGHLQTSYGVSFCRSVFDVRDMVARRVTRQPRLVIVRNASGVH